MESIAAYPAPLPLDANTLRARWRQSSTTCVSAGHFTSAITFSFPNIIHTCRSPPSITRTNCVHNVCNKVKKKSKNVYTNKLVYSKY